MYALMPPQDVFDYRHYPVRSSATALFREEKFVEPGEDVFMSGLLVYHPGATRMLPIIRTGTIAAFPAEPVGLSTGPEHVILIEAPSLGGLSGSPVFVHFSDWRRDRAGNLGKLNDHQQEVGAGANYLLGVMHGFYPATGNDPDGVGDASGEPLNSGIAVVIPVERIIELVNCPRFQEQRAMFRDRHKDAQRPIPTTSEESEFGRFENLVTNLFGMSESEADKVHRARGQDL